MPRKGDGCLPFLNIFFFRKTDLRVTLVSKKREIKKGTLYLTKIIYLVFGEEEEMKKKKKKKCSLDGDCISYLSQNHLHFQVGYHPRSTTFPQFG